MKADRANIPEKQAAVPGDGPLETPDTVLEFCLSHDMGVVADSCHHTKEVEIGKIRNSRLASATKQIQGQPGLFEIL